MSGLQIEINGAAYQGVAYQAGDGILIHLPGVQAPSVLAFESLFQPLPLCRLNGGFLEGGEWDGKSFPFESDLLFGLGPDGAVWAKVSDYLDELPLAENTPANLSLGWQMLAEAEEALGAKSMARERAACGNWPKPRTIQDYLMWLEDEAARSERQAADHTEESRKRLPYVRALRGLVEELRQLGFEPNPSPWAAADRVS
jgi:hypothetical protein